MNAKDKLLMGAMAGLLSLNVAATAVLADNHQAETHDKAAKTHVEKEGFFKRLFSRKKAAETSTTHKVQEEKQKVEAHQDKEKCNSKEGAKDECSAKDGCDSKDECKSHDKLAKPHQAKAAHSKDACAGKDGCKGKE